MESVPQLCIILYTLSKMEDECSNYSTKIEDNLGCKGQIRLLENTARVSILSAASGLSKFLQIGPCPFGNSGTVVFLCNTVVGWFGIYSKIVSFSFIEDLKSTEGTCRTYFSFFLKGTNNILQQHEKNLINFPAEKKSTHPFIF